ncbi:MFS general substrate transporter [Mycena chlorophos]|uniref:MFS general substrate transporter n=1 Tax=Mycena chlorophos TaxID=658473 RepID=A0A8H6TMD7_MYCCL|nr:MFS general substrate transporter [Mycena chlorophos]
MAPKDTDERSSNASPAVIDNSHNRDGTYYQSLLGPKAKRAHFFSPLDKAYSDACHRDAETVEYTEEEERVVRRKIDLTVLTLIICSCVSLPQHELALRISFCMTGTLPGAIGGLLAFGLVRAKTNLLEGWQFLFLIIMAFMILFFLPSFPFSATFLTPRERAIAQARLDRDQKPTSHGGMTGWQGFKAILADPNAWLFMLIYASFNVGVATVSYFLPTLILDLGYTAINAQGMTVAPYAVGWFMVVFQAWHSDRTKDRGWHVMASTAVSLVGYIILATSVQKSTGAAYFALFLVVGANYSLFPLVMSWAANTFSPTSKRGVGTAFIVSISNCVSIASPQIYYDPKDQYRHGHAISAGMLALSFLCAFALRTRLAYLNKRNAKILAERAGGGDRDAEKQPQVEEDDLEEVPDTDPRYVFMT